MSSPYTIANYNINDMFFNKPEYCIQESPENYTDKEPSTQPKTTSNCSLNYKLSKQMQSMQNQHSASQEKINNVQLLYSRELIYTINLSAGICGLILYLYYNK